MGHLHLLAGIAALAAPRSRRAETTLAQPLLTDADVEEHFDTAARQSHGQVAEAKQSLEASDKALASAIAARKQTQTVLSAKGAVKDEGAQAQRSVVDAVQEYREVEVQIEAQRKILLTFIEQTATDSPLAQRRADRLNQHLSLCRMMPMHS